MTDKLGGEACHIRCQCDPRPNVIEAHERNIAVIQQSPVSHLELPGVGGASGVPLGTEIQVLVLRKRPLRVLNGAGNFVGSVPWGEVAVFTALSSDPDTWEMKTELKDGDEDMDEVDEVLKAVRKAPRVNERRVRDPGRPILSALRGSALAVDYRPIRRNS